jgi:AcrR family transcriptional regulator
MRYSKAHKVETRAHIVDAALDTFRLEGYHGIGVDGIAKAAGVTSGAFYKHFNSKSEAFRTVVSEGLAILRNGILHHQRAGGAGWLDVFTNWYFSLPGKKAVREADHFTLPMEGGCALPALSPEIPRTEAKTQQLFEDEVRKIMEVIAAGLPQEPKARKRMAWNILALMIGGIVLARAVRSKETASEITKSVIAGIRLLTV